MDDNLRRMGLDKTRARKGAVRPKVTGEDVRRLLADVAIGVGVPFIDAASQAAQGNYGQAAISGLLDAPPVKMAGMALAPLIGMVRKAAPMDEALRIAQKNAAKPVSEGGLGLPPDNTPMDRAKAMGYGDPIYRGYQFGTGRNKATFYSSSPDLASAYAVRDPGFQYEVLSASGDRHLFGSLDEAKIAQQDVGGKIKKLKEAPTVQKNVMRSPKPLVIDAEGSNWDFIRNPFAPPENLENLQRRLNSVSKNLVINGKPYTVNQQKADILRDEYFNVYTDTNLLAELAKKRGYDSITIKNLFDVPLSAAGTDKDVKSLLSDVSISLKPENVRSRFAAFDPARINENNLLASLAALGISVPVMRGLLQEEEMQ